MPKITVSRAGDTVTVTGGKRTRQDGMVGWDGLLTVKLRRRDVSRMFALALAGFFAVQNFAAGEEEKKDPHAEPGKPPENKPDKKDAGDKKKDEKKEEKKDEKKPADAVPERPVSIGEYYDVPVLMANLKTDGRRPEFLVLTLTLQMEQESDREKVDKILPHIISSFQEYLRELDSQYLRGSMGTYKLREELLLRASTVASPIKIVNLFIKEILVK